MVILSHLRNTLTATAEVMLGCAPNRGQTFLRFIKFHKTVDCQPAQLCTPRLPPGWLVLCIQCTNTCYHLGMSLSIFSDLGFLQYCNIVPLLNQQLIMNSQLVCDQSKLMIDPLQKLGFVSNRERQCLKDQSNSY